MKTWLVFGIIAGVLLVAGIFLAGNITAHDDDLANSGTGCTADSCPNYGSGCTAENNCGLATCGAVNGQGGCGCGK